MKNAKIESKGIGPKKHILINDAGIGSNRLEMTNHYLNKFNYYQKNLIKMNKILEINSYERKKKLEKFRKDKEIPGLTFSSAYYKYTGNDYEYFENDKNNVKIKKAKINYLQDLLSKNENNNQLKLKKKNNKSKDDYIYKSLKLPEGLTKDKLINEEKKLINKDIIYNYKQKNKAFSLDKDDLLYFKTNYNIIKSNNIKCRIIFGRTLHNDSEYKKKEKNKKRNISYNKNKNNIVNYYTNSESLDKNEGEENFKKEEKSRINKMELFHKNKLLPLIK